MTPEDLIRIGRYFYRGLRWQWAAVGAGTLGTLRADAYYPGSLDLSRIVISRFVDAEIYDLLAVAQEMSEAGVFAAAHHKPPLLSFDDVPWEIHMIEDGVAYESALAAYKASYACLSCTAA